MCTETERTYLKFSLSQEFFYFNNIDKRVVIITMEQNNMETSTFWKGVSILLSNCVEN